MPDLPSRRAAEAGLLLVVLVWGLNFAVIKVPLAVVPPFTTNAIRFTVSVLTLGVFHLWQSRKAGRSPFTTLRVGVWPLVGLGFLGNVVYQAGFILGINRTTAGMAALLIASSPLWTALSAHVLHIDRLRRNGWIGFGLSLLGVLLVVLGRPDRSVGGDPVGIALLLGGACAWGTATALTRPLLDRGATPIGLSFWSIVAAYPFFLLLALLDVGRTPWPQVDAVDWAALVYSGGLSVGLAYGLWYVGVQRIGPSLAAGFSNLVPFVGVGAGLAFLGEPVQPLQILGGVVVIAGLVVMRRT